MVVVVEVDEGSEGVEGSLAEEDGVPVLLFMVNLYNTEIR